MARIEAAYDVDLVYVHVLIEERKAVCNAVRKINL